MNILGIDYDGIPLAQSAIAEYIQRIEAIIDRISADAGEIEYTEFIQGSDQLGALQGYMNDAILKIRTVTEYLSKFSDALDTVRQNYESYQGTVAGEMGTATDKEISSKTGVSGFGD